MELIVSMDGERIYLPAYVTFVLHPYVKNIRLGASAVATRVLFHALEERLAESRTRRFATWEEIEGDSALFDDAAQRIAAEGREATAAALRAHLVDIHERTLGAFRSFSGVRDFAERCIALISWVHDESTARDHPYFTPFSERFVDSLAAIARSLMAGKSLNDTPSYFALLRSYLQARHLSFTGTPLHGLQVLGALETRNLQFERVFILDANEGSLPESGSESTLLPLPVRTALGLSTYRDQEDIAAYHFELLAAGAKELHLFSVTGGERERSRFVERLLWEQQMALGALDEQRLVRSIYYKVSLSAAPPPSVAKTPAIIDWLRMREYSATALDTYLQCPLKLYYKNVLGLGPRDEPGGEIEAVDIGIFVHNVLFQYFTPRLGRPLVLSDADPEDMAALVDRMFVERFGSAEAGAFRLMRDQVRRHLRDFVDTYLRQLTADHRFTMQALEHNISASWHGFALRGRLDAVAERDGVSCLVDYKSGAHRASYAPRLSKLNVEDRDSWSSALPSLRLPFYVLLRSAETGQDPADMTAMVLLLGRNQMDRNIEVPLFGDPAEARAAWPRVSAVIAGLLDEIVSPDVPFASSRELKSRCTRCDFSGICGTAFLSRS